MKCKKCGGELSLSNGNLICQNCGSTFPVSDYYENTDAFLCYTESDSAGRRTRDSLIAQEIYNKLESKHINTFYSRISASSLTGDSLEKAITSAVISAKTIIVIGTQKKYFEELTEKYKEYFSGKVVIPVFSDMNPYDIPKNISSVQAMDYNRVGSDIDLVKALLNALNREDEIEKAISPKADNRKKALFILIPIIVVILGVFGYLYFGTQLFRSSANKTDNKLSLYNEAMKNMESNEPASAIEKFCKLKDYKDSKRQLQLLYEKYAGYYKNNESGLTVHLQVQKGSSANVETAQSVSDKLIKITESGQFQSTDLSLTFNDSENNKGALQIKLKNDGFDVNISTNTKNSEINIDDTTVFFPLSKKSDKPFTEKVDRNTLIGFINNRTTKGELVRKGYEISFESTLYKDIGSAKYKLKNTEIYFAIFNYDISKTDEYYGDENTSVDDPIVFGISAPAEIIIPEYIGKENKPFVDNDILFVPDGELSQNYNLLDFGIPDLIESKKIEATTPVCFTSKALIGEKHFNELVDYYINSSVASQTTNVSPNETVIDSDLNSDSSPNVWCPKCGKGYFITGVGLDGLSCSECGCVWLPSCAVCGQQNAAGIKDETTGKFKCNLCGAEWSPQQ